MSICNYELRIRRVDLGELSQPCGDAIRTPEDVVNAAKLLIGCSAQEQFLTFFLDTKNRVLGYNESARGGLDTCPVDHIASGSASHVFAV